MNRKQALALAIAALQKEYKQWLYISDSDASDKRRAEIAQAIEVLGEMLKKEYKRYGRHTALR